VSIEPTWRVAIPSLLTAVRVLVLPVIIVLSLRGLRVEAIGVYSVAVLSDVADGWAARRLGVATRFGATFDVLADMVVLLTLLIMLCVCGIAPPWLPVGPAAAAGAFLVTSRRSGPRYDPIGKHYGSVLYVLVGVLIWGVGPSVCTGICIAIVSLSVVVLLNRWIGMRSPAGR